MTAAAKVARIEDFDDPHFDPFGVFDRAGGLMEVDDPFPRLHQLAARGAVQKGDLREQFRLAPFGLFADLPSYMIFGYDAVTAA